MNVRRISMLALAALLGGSVCGSFAQTSEASTDLPLTPRAVYDSSDWGAMMGPLKTYWNTWKQSEAAAGRQWNDLGQIINLGSAQMVSSYRADTVPSSAIQEVAKLAKAAGLLVGTSPGEAATLQSQEAKRATEAARAAADKAEQEKREQEQREKEEAEGTEPGVFGQGGESSEELDGSGDPEDLLEGEDPDDPSAPQDPSNPNDPTDPSDPSDPGNPSDPGAPGSGGPEEVPPLPVDPPEDPAPNPSDLVVHRDLEYGQSHARQVLDLYLPPEAADGGPVPVVVFFHGGAFVAGDKGSVTPFLPFVSAGYALASANYQLLQKSSPGDIDFLEDAGEIAKTSYDARNAIRWLKDNASTYNLDASRFAVAGASAGGYIAHAVGAGSNESTLRNEQAISGTSPSVKAVIALAGPTNFATFPAHKGSGIPVPINLITATLNSKGAVSPYDFVSSGDPPHMIRHGQLDEVIPVEQSTTYAEALENAGVFVDLKTYPDLGHEPTDDFFRDELGLMIDFLDEHVQ